MIQRTIQVGKTRVDVDKIVAYEPYYSNDEHITLLLLDKRWLKHLMFIHQKHL